MQKRKPFATLTLTREQLLRLEQLVGNHTRGDDKHMYALFCKLGTLVESNKLDTYGPGKMLGTYPLVTLGEHRA